MSIEEIKNFLESNKKIIHSLKSFEITLKSINISFLIV